MEHPCFVGIDVSKAHLDVHVLPAGESFRVDHDDAGFVTLIARVRPFTPTVVVLEATGGYEVTVAAALAGAGLPVAVINGLVGVEVPLLEQRLVGPGGQADAVVGPEPLGRFVQDSGQLHRSMVPAAPTAPHTERRWFVWHPEVRSI
jgi:hypothetical protein